MTLSTRVTYMYRDAGNYKFRADFMVSGFLEITMISDYLIDNNYFVPSAVGLVSLVPQMRNGDDHEYHEFDGFVVMSELSENVIFDFKERLILASTNGWRYG